MGVDVEVGEFGAVVAGGDLHVAAEDATEIVGIGIAAFLGDLLDGEVTVEEVFAGFADALVVDGFGESATVDFAVDATEIVGVIADGLSDTGGGDGAVVVDADEGVGPCGDDVEVIGGGLFLFVGLGDFDEHEHGEEIGGIGVEEAGFLIVEEGAKEAFQAFGLGDAVDLRDFDGGGEGFAAPVGFGI